MAGRFRHRPITSAISSSKDTTAISPSKVGDFAQVSTDLTGTFKSLTESLTSIKDAASAETAVPKLRELDGKLDGLKALVDKLPDADRGKVADVIKASFGKVEDQFAKLL